MDFDRFWAKVCYSSRADMNENVTGGWITFIAALGMMCGLLAADVAKLNSWGQAVSPSFVSVVMAHFGAVVVAFIGGKMVPAARDGSKRTRSSDAQNGLPAAPSAPPPAVPPH